jgi:hypothetical protein
MVCSVHCCGCQLADQWHYIWRHTLKAMRILGMDRLNWLGLY